VKSFTILASKPERSEQSEAVKAKALRNREEFHDFLKESVSIAATRASKPERSEQSEAVKAKASSTLNSLQNNQQSTIN